MTDTRYKLGVIINRDGMHRVVRDPEGATIATIDKVSQAWRINAPGLEAVDNRVYAGLLAAYSAVSDAAAAAAAKDGAA